MAFGMGLDPTLANLIPPSLGNNSCAIFSSLFDMPEEDDEFEAGEAFGSLESAKWVGGLIMPVGGTIVEVNEDVEDDLEMLAEDPYEESWLILVEPSNLDDDLAKLIHGDDVKPWLEEELA